MILKPVNILFFSSFGDLLKGGQKSLFLLIANLNKEIFQAYVVAPNFQYELSSKFKNLGVDIHPLELPKIKNLNILHISKTIWKLCKIIDEYKIDIVHTDGPRNTFYAGIAAKIKNIPLIWHVRASNKDLGDRFLYKMSSKIILVADALKSRFDWSVDLKKSVSIYNGVDLYEFKQKKGLNQLRNKYAINSKDLIITVCARIEPLKGQIHLIEACGKLKDNFSDFRILFAGEIADNSYMDMCNQLAFQLGIHNHIILTGPLNNINQVLNETDIFVLPSSFEAFPRSIIEAMATGLPVIATDVGGNSEAVENNVSGLIVPPEDPIALAGKIQLLVQNSNLRLKMGMEARKRAEKLFSIGENVKKIEGVYREILGKI